MFVHYPIFEQSSQVSESTQPGLQSKNAQGGHIDLQVESEFSLVLLLKILGQSRPTAGKA